MAARLGRRLIAMEQPILARHGVTMWAYVVLNGLAGGEVRTQAALASRIGADKTRLIPVLDSLQERALISREPDPDDRRVRLLALTDAGHSLHSELQGEIRAAEELLLGELSPEDRETFLRTLAALSDRPET